MPTDYVSEYDTEITTGFYYIEIHNCFPCHGNGWYCDSFVKDALSLQVITHDHIKYQIKPSQALHPNFFEDFVNSVAEHFAGYKKANNGFVGILAKKYNTYDKTYFTQDRMVALKEWIENPTDVSFSGIYDYSQGLCHYEFMMRQDKLQTIIDNAKQNQYDPMVWLININKKTTV